MSSALFSNSRPTGGATGAPSNSKSLVEFKAGKMSLKGKMVTPDKRKGLVYIYQSEDSLMHFCWKDRTTDAVEDDLMIFPDDVEHKKVTQCTTGRVFLLKFKSNNKKLFFWMQEPETEKDKDDKLWRKLNDLLNNPPMPGSSSTSSSSAGDRGTSNSTAAGLASAFGSEFGGLGGTELQQLLSSMDEQQLQMFLGGFMPSLSSNSSRGGSSSNASNNTQTSRADSSTAVDASASAATPKPKSTTTPTTPSATSATKLEDPAIIASSLASSSSSATAAAAAASSSGDDKTGQKIQLSDLQSILGNINSNPSTQQQELDLAEIISIDTMAPILANKSIQEKLVQYLPDSEILPKTEAELKTTLTTPQFKKAMSSFGSALQSGQLGPLMKQFDLPEEVTVAAAQGNLVEFAKAMETFCRKKDNNNKKDEEEDNQMDTK